MNTSGMQALGFWALNLDAEWDLLDRDAAGNLQPDPAPWPSGLPATVAYVHSLGLGFGLYGDRGTKDCSGRPGNLGHEAQDAAFYAEMEIDWYKSDSCYAAGDPQTAFTEYGTMRDALNKTGRHIWFALCGWEPFYAPVGQTLGNSWRVGVDTGSGWGAIMSNVESMLSLAKYAGPTASGGGWNDMSLLLTPGMGSGASLMSKERFRSQFALHCIFAANILLTGNLSAHPPYVLETWMNAEAVAVNQDVAGLPFVVLAPEPSPFAPHAYVQAKVAECGGEPGLQNWTYGVPLAQFLQNAATAQCLNVDDCGTPIIYDGCTTTGATCAGKGVFSNEQWQLPVGTGALKSDLPGGKCVTVGADSTLSLSPCGSPLPESQSWTYTPASGELETAGGLCVTAAASPPPANTTTLLIGRPLHDGSRALLALNNLPVNSTIVCGSDCFTGLGFAPGVILHVRDLWAHADVGTINTSQTFPMPVGANGASVMFKLTPE
jgi:hypothetical protein